MDIIEDFEFNDYYSNATVSSLKEYFLTTFGFKHPYCKCELSIYSKENHEYALLSDSDDTLLRIFIPDRLYLIRTNVVCNCEYKNYFGCVTIEKFSLIKKIKILEEEINNLQQLAQEKDLKNEELQKEIKKLIERENSIENIKIENLNLKNKINKLSKVDETKERKNKKFEDFYDIIININSIKNVSKDGWQVKFTEEGLKKYNKYKNKELITIGVLGNNNKGKSFLLSKISKIKLLTGTSIHTEGLSVKYPELKGYKGRQLILLDSAGFETPVLRKNKEKVLDEDKNNEEFKEKARDKIATEYFLQNFVIKTSNILFVVVGKLTYSEQLLINKVKVESKKQNISKIFIIHNLQEFRTRDQVEDYIKNNTLLKCSTFNLNKRTWVTAQKDVYKEEDEKKK